MGDKLEEDVLARLLKGDMAGFGVKSACPKKRKANLRWCDNCEEFHTVLTGRRSDQYSTSCPECGSETKNAVVCDQCGKRWAVDNLVDNTGEDKFVGCKECGGTEFKALGVRVTTVLRGFKNSCVRERLVCKKCGKEYYPRGLFRRNTFSVPCPNCESEELKSKDAHSEEYYHKHHNFSIHPIDRNHKDERKRHPNEKEKLEKFIDLIQKHRES